MKFGVVYLLCKNKSFIFSSFQLKIKLYDQSLAACSENIKGCIRAQSKDISIWNAQQRGESLVKVL